jgi:hypothetical protein
MLRDMRGQYVQACTYPSWLALPNHTIPLLLSNTLPPPTHTFLLPSAPGSTDCAARLALAHDPTAAQMLAQKMAEELFSLPLDEALPIVRAYGHFLK